MSAIFFFLIFSVVWAILDYLYTSPISKLIGTSEEISECIIGGVLGCFLGIYYGPIIAFSFQQKKSSWIATICLIVSSFIFSNL